MLVSTSPMTPKVSRFFIFHHDRPLCRLQIFSFFLGAHGLHALEEEVEFEGKKEKEDVHLHVDRGWCNRIEVGVIELRRRRRRM